MPPGFGYGEDSLVGKVFGGAAEYKDQCWSPFLLLAQSVAKDHLDWTYC